MRHPATAAIVTACLGLHAYLATLTEPARVAFEDTWGMTPAFVTTAFTVREAATLASSLFLHAGFGTLLASVAALIALGPRVERRMGSVGFLVFFVISGALGGLYRCWSDPGVITPQVGSGAAVAGVALAWLLSRISAGQSMSTPVRHSPSALSAGTAS